jgi:hypothetical protein
MQGGIIATNRNGQTQWTGPSDWKPQDAAVDVSRDGTLVVVAGDRIVRAFGGSGATLWAYDTGHPHIGNSALWWRVKVAASSKTIAALSLDGLLIVLDVGGNLMWSKSFPQTQIAPSLAISSNGERVLVGTGDSVYAFNAQGDQAWKASFADNVVSIAMSPYGNVEIVKTSRGDIFSLDWSSGTTQWSALPYDPNNWSMLTGSDTFREWICISDDGAKIYTIHMDGIVYAFSAQGNQLWSHPLQSPVWPSELTCSPSGARLVLAAGSSDEYRLGSVFFLDDSGTVLWQYQRTTRFHSPVLSGDGRTVVASDDEGSYAWLLDDGPATYVSFQLNPSPVAPSELITASGYLQTQGLQPIKNAVVRFRARLQGQGWVDLGESSTDDAGFFAFHFSLTNPGTYTIQAAYQGTENHLGCTYDVSLLVSPFFVITFDIDANPRPRSYGVYVDRRFHTSSELPLTFNWAQGTDHTLGVNDGESGIDGTWAFKKWNDGVLTSHRTITVAGPTSYIAKLSTTPDFAIASDRNTLRLYLPDSGLTSQESTVTVLSILGFESPVVLTCSWVGEGPSGVDYSLNPPVVVPTSWPGSTSTLILTANPAASTGMFTFRVVGTNSLLVDTTDVTVEVTHQPPPSTEPAQLRSKTIFGDDLSGLRVKVEWRESGHRRRMTLVTPFSLDPSAQGLYKFTAPSTVRVGGVQYRFAHWEDETRAILSGGRTLSYNVQPGKTLYVVFGPRQYRLTVDVKNATGARVAGATVEVTMLGHTYTAVTNSRGKAIIRGIYAGQPFDLKITINGVVRYERTLTITRNTTHRAYIT